ncbi:MAG: hypothetical protein EVB11_11335 [Winogradskyella sp.]|nr:MAG: hypothetical protein EVB11_11335 [Winogradskyella sp.]
MLNVKHFLNIYQTRKRLFDEGITNPLPEVKEFITELIEKLSIRNPKEELELLKNEKGIMSLINKKGNVIITFPNFEKLGKDNHLL